MHLPPGTVLHEKYLLGRALGQGGFGITYIARDLYLDRKLAIKEFFPRELSSRDQKTGQVTVYSEKQREQFRYGLEKFLEEGRTLARFEGHPNIVSVQNFFKEKNTAYLVMNYIQGIALNDYLGQRGEPLPFEEAMQIMMPVLDALKAVHDAGMLHRDISPDNIFMTAKGRVMILDFGAARHAMSAQNRSFSIILKPGYAPPEQYRQKGNQGPWTDVYAAAATFYQVVIGEMPPDGLERLDQDFLPWPQWTNQVLTEGQRRALEQALAIRTENRFQSVTAFQEALFADAGRAALQEQPVTEPVSVNVPEPISEMYSRPNRQTTDESGGGKKNHLPDNSIQVTPVSGAAISVGRSSDNDIVVRDETVSRYHARLYREGCHWYVSDLESTHGTYFNGHPVTEPVLMTPSAYIQVSRVMIYYDGTHLLSEKGEILHTLTMDESGSFQRGNAPHPSSGYRTPASSGFHQEQRRPELSGNSGKMSQAASVSQGIRSWPGGRAFAGKPAKIILLAALILLFLFLIMLLFQAIKGDGPGSAGTQTESIETGTIDFAGGTYTGELKNGLPHGTGTWIFRSTAETSAFGEIRNVVEISYEGEWKEGRRHGIGVQHNADGAIQRGRWENDVFRGRE